MLQVFEIADFDNIGLEKELWQSASQIRMSHHMERSEFTTMLDKRVFLLYKLNRYRRFSPGSNAHFEMNCQMFDIAHSPLGRLRSIQVIVKFVHTGHREGQSLEFGESGQDLTQLFRREANIQDIQLSQLFTLEHRGLHVAPGQPVAVVQTEGLQQGTVTFDEIRERG